MSLTHEAPAYGTPSAQEGPAAPVPAQGLRGMASYLVVGGFLDSHERHGITVTAANPRDAEVYARSVAPPGAPYIVCGVVQVVGGVATLVDQGRFFDQVD